MEKSGKAPKLKNFPPRASDTAELKARMARVIDQMSSASPFAMRHIQHMMEVIPTAQRASGKSRGEQMVGSLMRPALGSGMSLPTDLTFQVLIDDVIPGSTISYIYFGVSAYSLPDRDLGMLLLHETLHARTYGGGPASQNNNNTFREEVASYFSEYLVAEEWFRKRETVETMYKEIADLIRGSSFYSTLRPGSRAELDLHFTAYGVKQRYTPEQWKRLSDFCDAFQAKFKW